MKTPWKVNCIANANYLGILEIENGEVFEMRQFSSYGDLNNAKP